MSPDPLVVQFEVAAAPAHAFRIWTERCATWWPGAHTVSGRPAAIVFEPRPGGRIFERSGDGAEHDWGEVLDWEPPTRLRWRWHLFVHPSEATEIELTFRAHGARTVVRLEQRGWEALGGAGPPRRQRSATVWERLSADFATACASSVSQSDSA